MNSRCHCVVIIIGICTAMATRSRGGQTFRSHRSRRRGISGKEVPIPICQQHAKDPVSLTLQFGRQINFLGCHPALNEQEIK